MSPTNMQPPRVPVVVSPTNTLAPVATDGADDSGNRAAARGLLLLHTPRDGADDSGNRAELLVASSCSTLRGVLERAAGQGYLLTKRYTII